MVPFETADDLHGALVREFPECDGLVMAAAVADFIPEESAERLHRSDGREDAAARVRAATFSRASGLCGAGRRSIAFAAETENLEARGRRKRDAKGADLSSSTTSDVPTSGSTPGTTRC